MGENNYLQASIDLHETSALMAFLLYGRTFLIIFLVIVFSQLYFHPFLYLLTIFIIAARQHSLYVLNHDASHGNLFKSYAWNKVIATVFSNAFFFHHPEAFSFVLWRRIHRLHHAFLFTDKDPNYVGRKNAGDAIRQYSHAEVFILCVKAMIFSFYNFFFMKQDYVGPDDIVINKKNHLSLLLFPIAQDEEMEIERKFKIIFFSVFFISLSYFGAWKIFFLYWVLPMYTMYPFILRLMDLTEHNWYVNNSADLEKNSNTIVPGIMAKIFISDCNRSYHWEHHRFPRVPLFRLPELSMQLRGQQVGIPLVKTYFLRG